MGSLMFNTWLNSFLGIGESWLFWTTNVDKLSQLARWVDRPEEGFKPRGAGWQTLYLQLVAGMGGERDVIYLPLSAPGP